MKEPIVFCWSGGKDSVAALHALRDSPDYEVAALLTTVTADYGRVSMHGLRESLLDAQAVALGLPLDKAMIPKDCTDEIYEARMAEALQRHAARGIRTVAFGDIFLEDLRTWREERLARIGMRAIFPIWKRDTTDLARAFIADGFQAVLTCVDTHALAADYAGRRFDPQFLSELPQTVDPCGENGEFHSFVYAGPLFAHPILFTEGARTLRDNRFAYCDLLPA